uniref:C6 domain-containing protein n=1 Tax=Caenorhabditis japonica TaxID=281687 RepID=A0A8R1DK19_CAEJA
MNCILIALFAISALSVNGVSACGPDCTFCNAENFLNTSYLVTPVLKSQINFITNGDAKFNGWKIVGADAAVGGVYYDEAKQQCSTNFTCVFTGSTMFGVAVVGLDGHIYNYDMVEGTEENALYNWMGALQLECDSATNSFTSGKLPFSYATCFQLIDPADM